MVGTRLGKADVCEDAVDEVTRHLCGALGMVVERRNGREDCCSSIRGQLHVAQVDTVERSLADAKDERATLLEGDIGGAMDEV